MQGDVGRREGHRLEARLRGGPLRAMARARCVRRRAQWRARGMRMACACAWLVRGVCLACAWRVRGVCVACAWRVHLGPRRTSPGKKAVAASAESSTRVPARRGGAAAAGSGEVGGGHRGKRGTSRGERGQCAPSTSASAGAGGGARIGSVALAAARVEGRQWGHVSAEQAPSSAPSQPRSASTW